MTLLTPGELLAEDRYDEPVKVNVPEFGEGKHIFVARLNADERDLLEEQWAEQQEEMDTEGMKGFRSFASAFCACDADGERYYRSGDDVRMAAEKLGKRYAGGVTRMFNTVCSINGLLKADVDELEKN